MNKAGVPTQHLPFALKLFGGLCVVGGLIGLGELLPVATAFAQGVAVGEYKTAVAAIFAVLMVVLLAITVLFVVLGVLLARARRTLAAQLCRVLIALDVAAILGTAMLFGLSLHHVGYLAQIVMLIALSSYLDPALARERKAARHPAPSDAPAKEGPATAPTPQPDASHATGDGTAAPPTTVDGAPPQPDASRGPAGDGTAAPKGLVTLNFFNLFWVFVVCCVLGVIIEGIYFIVVFHVLQNRTGLLFGPFSPVYGFGAVLITVALNRFHDKPIWIIFLVSALIGGAFEYAMSWVMEFAYGASAWDYTGTTLSIGGRTNLVFMCMWGVLGVVWIRFLLAKMLKLVNLIPWNWRYGVTTACAALVLLDGVMTSQALDCWCKRISGREPTTPVEQFYATCFDDGYMADRFPKMTMDPAKATRVDLLESMP